MDRTQTYRRLWAIAPLAFLVFGTWQTGATLWQEPAFNRSLQVDIGRGSGILGYTEKMFGQAEYLHWVAKDWRLRTKAAMLTGELKSPEQDEEIDARFVRIRDTALESLRNNPGNASAWILVAEAQAELGERVRALESYQHSRDLLPNSSTSALARLYFLIDFMSEPEGRDLAQAKIAPGTVFADLQAVRTNLIFENTADQMARNPAIASFINAQTSQ